MEPVIVQCPACWEEIELQVDVSGGSAEYAEDCPVCCRPMRVRLTVGEDGQPAVDVEPES